MPSPPNLAHSPVRLRRVIWMTLAAAFLSAPLHGQIRVYPPELYGGMNEITITAASGIARVEMLRGGRWTRVVTGINTSLFRIVTSPVAAGCGTRARMLIFVKTITQSFSVPLRITDCDGATREVDLGLEDQWSVYYEDFGRVLVGATACHTFRVDANGTNHVIDRIVSPSRLFTIRYRGNGSPPTRIPRSGVFLYDVCLTATSPGKIKMPILVYIRRRYPAGGQTTFVVADTAYATVVEPAHPNRATPPGNPPARRPARRPSLPPPKPPSPPPAPTPDVVPVHAITTPLSIPPPDTRTSRVSGLPQAPSERTLTDPTTHRVMLLPSPRPVAAGGVVVSNYELGGWLLGYGADENLTLLAGGAYIPSFIDRNVVGTLGGRYQVFEQDYTRVAVGLQGTYTRSDVSEVIVGSPYATAAVGDDDQRATLAVGYSWRRHRPLASEIAPFNRQALAIGLGGEYRIGYHWKVVAEALATQGADLEPAALTLRYFERNYAIDVGIAADLSGGDSPSWSPTIVPAVAVSYVW